MASCNSALIWRSSFFWVFIRNNDGVDNGVMYYGASTQKMTIQTNNTKNTNIKIYKYKHVDL